MLIDTKKMIPVTKLQRELTKKLREVSENGEPLYILKNNHMQAVIISFEEYEAIKELEEMIEYLEIDDVIKERLKKYNQKENVSWDEIKNK